MSNSMPCQGQVTISPSRTHANFQSVAAEQTIVPLTVPAQRGPNWWGQTLGRAYKSPFTLKTPTAIRPSVTTRCVPGGNSSTSPTTYSATCFPYHPITLRPYHPSPVLQLACGRRDAEQL